MLINLKNNLFSNEVITIHKLENFTQRRRQYFGKSRNGKISREIHTGKKKQKEVSNVFQKDIA